MGSYYKDVDCLLHVIYFQGDKKNRQAGPDEAQKEDFWEH